MDSRRGNRWLGFICFLSSILILAAARGDLWLDEIWSFNMARSVNTATDIFLKIHHDNNHPLNTLYLYMVGETAPLYTYRLLSVLCGIGAVFLAGEAARHLWGAREALLGSLLVGTSFPLLLYFSEARGYASAIFFALLAFLALVHFLNRPQVRWLLVYRAACVLGVLAHATFAIAAVAFLLMHATVLARPESRFNRIPGELIRVHGISLGFIVFWCLFFMRDLTIGGGPVYSGTKIALDTASLLLGAPGASPFPALAVLVLATVLLAGILWLIHDRRPEWTLFPGILLLSPALLLLVARPQFVYFRYFLVSFPFFYLLLAYLLVRLGSARRSGWRILSVVIVAGVLVGQGIRIHPLLTLGRGRYSEALDYMVKNSSGSVVRIGTDHDFRNRMLIDFYVPRLKSEKTIRYIEQKQWRREPPEWLVTQSQEPGFRPEERFLLDPIGSYRLQAEYRFAGVSGWHWFVYRREAYNGSS